MSITTPINEPLKARLVPLRSFIEMAEETGRPRLNRDESDQLEEAIDQAWPGLLRKQYWLYAMTWFCIGGFLVKYALGH